MRETGKGKNIRIQKREVGNVRAHKHKTEIEKKGDADLHIGINQKILEIGPHDRMKMEEGKFFRV